MSGVNISILEGGKAENFGQVTKLRTSNGTDHDLWVPKTDVETKHLSVKKNGLHYTNQYQPTASEKKNGKFHDVYGWDTITVSVKKKVTGKKKKTSPSTGIEYDAPTSVDVDDNGNLVETELPVSIEIERPPSKLEYNEGEVISKSGMVVKAYYADDSEWGIVPNDEITLNPVTASSSDSRSGEGVSLWHKECFVFPAVFNKGMVAFEGKGDRVEISGNYEAAFITVDRANKLSSLSCAISRVPFILIITTTNLETGKQTIKSRASSQLTTRSGRTTFYYCSFGSGYLNSAVVVVGQPSVYTCGIGNYQDVGSIYYESSDAGGAETITASWIPPEGEEELTDTFDITVTA